MQMPACQLESMMFWVSVSSQSLRGPHWGRRLTGLPVEHLRPRSRRVANWGLENNLAYYGQQKKNLWVTIAVCFQLPFPVSLTPHKLWLQWREIYFYKEVLSFILHTLLWVYKNIKYIYGLFRFYGVSTIIGYLMPNLRTYILNMYDFVCLSFMAYQPL